MQLPLYLLIRFYFRSMGTHNLKAIGYGCHFWSDDVTSMTDQHCSTMNSVGLTCEHD